MMKQINAYLINQVLLFNLIVLEVFINIQNQNGNLFKVLKIKSVKWKNIMLVKADKAPNINQCSSSVAFPVSLRVQHYSDYHTHQDVYANAHDLCLKPKSDLNCSCIIQSTLYH